MGDGLTVLRARRSAMHSGFAARPEMVASRGVETDLPCGALRPRCPRPGVPAAAGNPRGGRNTCASLALVLLEAPGGPMNARHCTIGLALVLARAGLTEGPSAIDRHRERNAP
jgi:hypothetical protein